MFSKDYDFFTCNTIERYFDKAIGVKDQFKKGEPITFVGTFTGGWGREVSFTIRNTGTHASSPGLNIDLYHEGVEFNGRKKTCRSYESNNLDPGEYVAIWKSVSHENLLGTSRFRVKEDR